MRYSAVATDPMDFTCALRLEIGFDQEMTEFEPVLVAAAVTMDGGSLLKIGGVLAKARDPAVIWSLDVSPKLHEPARSIIFRSMGSSLTMTTGYTLWASMDRTSPLLLISTNGDGAFAVTPAGLVRLSSAPLGIKKSKQSGIDRAVERLSDRMLAIASSRDVPLLAD